MSDSEESNKHESSEESTTSEEEDENGKEWTEEIEKTFLKTLSSLKSKDPKIYNENVKFFDKEIGTSANNKPAIKNKEDQPLYLRDYERKIILEKNGVLTDEDSDNETTNNRKNKRSQSPSYVEEQRILKEGFKKFLNSDSDNEPSDSENNCAGFLKTKIKTIEEKTKEEEEYVEWLKGQRTTLNDTETESQLKYLRDYWTDPNLNEGEQFLRDYILNKRFLEPNTTPDIENEVSFSEEERILEECEEYEQMYNFRFEEPDKNFIKTYPRNIETSLRRKGDTRKKKREERKKRKEEQLQQKHIEVKKLKKQKKEELIERIQKLKELTGNAELGFDDKDLQNDFSPNEYDKKMSELFNEEFYANEDDMKPVFSDSDIEYDDCEEDYADEENFKCENENDEYSENQSNESNELLTENKNFIMDCDYDPLEEKESKFKKQTRSSGRKGHKKTKFAQIIEKEKPIFNPADKTFQQYVDEYYGLEFEDIIGDMPCRYNYRKVTPNSFGLTVEEILAADDKELNKWCSMQKIIALRPEQNEKFDLKVYSRRGQNLELKKKFLPSLFKEENNEESKSVDINNGGNTQKNKKKKKRKSKANASVLESNDTKNSVVQEKTVNSTNDRYKDNYRKGKKRKADSDINRDTKQSRVSIDFQKNHSTAQMKRPTPDENRRKKKFNSQNQEGKKTDLVSNLSDERLKAYGINPKRFKNKLKYGPNKN